MKTLKKIWLLRIATFYNTDMDMDQDVVLDLRFEILDINHCIVFNDEIQVINVFEMKNGKVIMTENLDGGIDGSNELYQTLAD